MLSNPYVVAAIVALLTATLFTLYTKFTDKDEKKLATKFAQVFLAALVAGIAFTFVTGSQNEETLNIPFQEGGLADF
jgi:type II secretory pathway pseudopilin PulG